MQHDLSAEPAQYGPVCLGRQSSRLRGSRLATAANLACALILTGALAAWTGAVARASAQDLTEASCGGDYVCLADNTSVAAAQPQRSPLSASLEKAAYRQQCREVAADVTAASAEEHSLVCAAAADALRLLGRCGISLRRPLDVQIVRDVRHPSSRPTLGMFDVRQEKVVVAHQQNISLLVEGTPYALLPQRDFYKSLIVHEVVHAVMHQNLKRPAATHAAYEYPAYALQIESLEPQVRQQFLQTFEQVAIQSDALFSDIVLFFDPYVFAARAYHHFRTSADGCSHLTALLDGEVAFIAPPQM